MLQSGYGLATWSSPEWLRSATDWIDDRLREAGIDRRGEVERNRLRPWSALLTVPIRGGRAWFKATAPATAFEAPLYEHLARLVPERVLVPLGVDADRGWMLLPDGGVSIGESLSGDALLEALGQALATYGDLQRRLSPSSEEMAAIGVEDMTPGAMPKRFDEAVAAVAADPELDGEDRVALARVVEMRERFSEWCERLAASPISSSVDHNDLHGWNVLGDAEHGFRFYDWGDAVLAHPFASMLVPASIMRSSLDGGLEDPRFLRARDAYLEVFSDLGSRTELVETLELACRVAKVARALTWSRALQAARDQGEMVDPDYGDGARESLFALLAPSYAPAA